MLDLSIIIVNWNTKLLLQNCLNSVFSTIKKINFEVLVVDNGSWDGSPEMVKENFPGTRLIQNRLNLGFAKANNIAIEESSGRYIALVNSDTELTEGAADGIVKFLDENSRVGAAAPQYINRDGTKQNSFDNFPSLATELVNKSLLRALFPSKYPSKNIDYEGPLYVESLIGAFLVLRSAALENVGRLDEGYFFFLEETDLCLRLKNAEWLIVHLPWIKIYHLQGKSKDRAPGKAWIEYYRSNYRFFKKNRTAASYLVLRVLKLTKLMVNLLLTASAVLFTFSKKRRLRRRLLIYAQLVWWHLNRCPPHMGLRQVLSEKENYISTRHMGIKWKIKKGCEGLIHHNSEIDFENLAQSQGVTPFKDSRIKTLALARLNPTDGCGEFLIKFYKCSGIASRLSYILRRSKAERELFLSRKFSTMGIPTILPVAIGVNRKFRILAGSYVIHEKIRNASDLETFFTDTQNISPSFRKKIIEKYGRLARRIHDCGIVQSDFDPNNILIERCDDDNVLFYFIDYERVRHFRRISRSKRAWSLAKMNRFSKGVTVAERMRFLKSYVGDRPFKDADFRAFALEILAAGHRVMKRDIRRAARNSLKMSSKIGRLSHRGIRCYFRKRYLKEKKYSGPDIRAIIDAIFRYDMGIKGRPHAGQSLDLEINGTRKRLLVFTFPAKRVPLPLTTNRARDVWRALNSLLKIDLPALFPVALIEGKTQKIKNFIIVEFAGPLIFQKKLDRIQALKGRLPDGQLERLTSGIDSFRRKSYMKENWFIIGCQINAVNQRFFLSPGKVPV